MKNKTLALEHLVQGIRSLARHHLRNYRKHRKRLVHSIYVFNRAKDIFKTRMHNATRAIKREARLHTKANIGIAPIWAMPLVDKTFKSHLKKK
jgi:hypothetical protein